MPDFRARRTLLLFTLAAGICFLLGFIISYEAPKLRSWMLVKIEELSRDRLPVRILPGKIEVQLLPLGATLTNVRIMPKSEVEDVFDSALIERISITASPWPLLSGHLRISDLSVSGADISATIPSDHKKKSGSPLEGFFDLLAQVPLSRLQLEDVNLRLKVEEPDLQLNINGLALTAEKLRGGTLLLGLNSVSLQAIDPVTKMTVRLDAETQLTLSRELVTVSGLKIRRGDSFVAANGHVTGDIEALKFKEIDFRTDAELQLESLRNWSAKTFKELNKLPQLKGRAFVEAVLKKELTAPLTANFKARTDGFQLEKMRFDRIEAAGFYSNNELSIPHAKMENAAGIIALEELKGVFGEKSSLKAQLKTSGLQIHELLKTLGVGDIPVWVQIWGDLPCSGTLKPFQIDCKGNVKSENILVRDSVKSRSTIVAVRKLEATGEVTIDAEKVSYRADLTSPNSHGKSDGVISYDEGFKINYETDKLAMADITNLADLKIEGAARIKGSTEGNSDAATLAMDIEGSDVWFEDFWLGNPKGNVAYKAGQLSFANLSGYYTVSRYTGDVKLDLTKNEIAITGRAPFFDARDMLKVFSRRVKLPFNVTGTGQATVKASGPLALGKLTYDLKTSVFKGSAASETFDQAYFNVSSVKGEVKADRVQVIKGTSVATLTGVAHPDGTIKTMIEGRGIKVEDSMVVASSGLALSGIVDFDMTLQGPVLAPDTDMKGTLTKTAIGDQGVPDSDFRMKFRARTIEGAGSLLGHVLNAAFTLPLEPTAPFSLKLTSTDWNYAPLFAAIAGPSSRKDYEGRLTSAIDIASPSGGLWNATGTIKVDKFSLARGTLALRSLEPLSMSMKNGQLHIDRFDLSGDNIFLKLSESPNPVAKVDLQVNGKIDMTLLALLMPFFEDLRGVLSFAFNLRAGPTVTELLGSAYIDKAYLKFFDFPHPIENLQADLLFNQRKILFNTIKAEFGGGRVSGTGGMELKGYKNYPVNVAGTFDKVTVNIPDKVRTTGSGTLSFTGNWFPFALKVDYDIKEGNITKELGGSSTENDGIRRDFFLPDALLAESFTPILLDMNIAFNRGIVVKNDLVDGRVLGNLSVKGKPGKPSILGTITTDRETNIIVKDTPFEVTSSNIQFIDPNEINPKLYLAARARVREYDVNIIIQGSASNPQLQFSSVPPLAEKDIISLLALGVTDTQNNTVKSGEQGSSSALNIGSGVIKKNPVTNLIKDSIGFDVQFSPGFDDTGSSAVQKIVVSRQFNQRIDFTASRSIGGRGQETQARARYRLNSKVSVVGSWLGRDYTETVVDSQPNIQNPNAFGLDLEYKFEFK